MTSALLPGMSDAEAQAPEGLADVRDDVAQAIVAAVAAALFQAHAADRQVQFIVGNQNFLRRDFVEIAQLAHRRGRCDSCRSSASAEQFPVRSTLIVAVSPEYLR